MYILFIYCELCQWTPKSGKTLHLSYSVILFLVLRQWCKFDLPVIQTWKSIFIICIIISVVVLVMKSSQLTLYFRLLWFTTQNISEICLFVAAYRLGRHGNLWGNSCCQSAWRGTWSYRVSTRTVFWLIFVNT